MYLAFLNKQPGEDCAPGRTATPAFIPCLKARLKTCLKLLVLLALPAPALACPDLQAYYPTGDDQWERLAPQLVALMPECLESAEYFALLGAAQLNTGQLPAALEALERALLLDPNNGAARIDYAQGLYAAGQLFAALELNQTLLAREDLPPELVSMLQARQQAWQDQRRSRRFDLEVAAGYDDNLNGAPSRSDFTLTLAGQPIPLTLDPEYQPVSGAYANVKLGAAFRKLSPRLTHDVQLAVRHRASEYSASNLLQFDGRYALAIPLRRYQWDLSAGASHLQFGGSPLYSVSEARARLRATGDGCRPDLELAAQHQLYHGQSVMSGLESSASVGMECLRDGGRQLFGIEAGALRNAALDANRPGGNRHGWQLSLVWLLQFSQSTLSTQYSYASLQDAKGYSPLLDNGAVRQVNNRFFRVRYSRFLQPDLAFVVNLSHQGQGSNIRPFENRGTALDLGLNLSF